MSVQTATNFKRLLKFCEVSAIAQKMKSEGYSLEQALSVLKGK